MSLATVSEDVPREELVPFTHDSWMATMQQIHQLPRTTTAARRSKVVTVVDPNSERKLSELGGCPSSVSSQRSTAAGDSASLSSSPSWMPPTATTSSSGAVSDGVIFLNQRIPRLASISPSQSTKIAVRSPEESSLTPLSARPASTLPVALPRPDYAQLVRCSLTDTQTGARCATHCRSQGELAQHLVICPYRPAQCVNEHCRRMVSLYAMPAHAAKCCIEARCRYCAQNCHPSIVVAHEATCTAVRVICPLGCGHHFARRDLHAHIAETWLQHPLHNLPEAQLVAEHPQRIIRLLLSLAHGLHGQAVRDATWQWLDSQEPQHQQQQQQQQRPSAGPGDVDEEDEEESLDFLSVDEFAVTVQPSGRVNGDEGYDYCNDATADTISDVVFHEVPTAHHQRSSGRDNSEESRLRTETSVRSNTSIAFYSEFGSPSVRSAKAEGRRRASTSRRSVGGTIVDWSDEPTPTRPTAASGRTGAAAQQLQMMRSPLPLEPSSSVLAAGSVQESSLPQPSSLGPTETTHGAATARAVSPPTALFDNGVAESMLLLLSVSSVTVRERKVLLLECMKSYSDRLSSTCDAVNAFEKSGVALSPVATYSDDWLTTEDQKFATGLSVIQSYLLDWRDRARDTMLPTSLILKDDEELTAAWAHLDKKWLEWKQLVYARMYW